MKQKHALLYSTRSQSALFDAPFWLRLRQSQKKCSTAWKAASALFFRLPCLAKKCAVKNAHILTALSIAFFLLSLSYAFAEDPLKVIERASLPTEIRDQTSSDISLLQVKRLNEKIPLDDCVVVETNAYDVVLDCTLALEKRHGIKSLQPLYLRASRNSVRDPLIVNSEFSLMEIRVLIRKTVFEKASSVGFYVSGSPKPALFPISRFTKRSHTLLKDGAEGIMLDFLLIPHGSVELKPFIDFEVPRGGRVIYRNWDIFPASYRGANYSIASDSSLDRSGEFLFQCGGLLANTPGELFHKDTQ